jgi:hypothetical protein
MTFILLGILLYGLLVLFFCALTRANGPEEEANLHQTLQTLQTLQPTRAEERFEPVSARGAVHAREVHL